jgi:hypothetical protein
MPASLNVAAPIYPLKVLIGGTAQAVQRRLPELAGQTFLQGVPVQVQTTTGFIQETPAITSVATAIIAGFSTEPASNLLNSGVAKTLTQQGHPPFQTFAVFIPVGAWPNDGAIGLHQAVDSTVFIGIVGHGNDNDQAKIAQTDLGAIFGLTKDLGNMFWYIDKAKTTAAAGAVAQITDLLDPVGTLNGRVGFKVLHAACQLAGL